jgi:hypothetical protein
MACEGGGTASDALLEKATLEANHEFGGAVKCRHGNAVAANANLEITITGYAILRACA